MQHQALYRKYRPQRFDQVVGQEHVTQTLLREITEGRVAHAYLFAGPRGTGKTTTARLLAKALNCPDRSPAGEPCDDCHSCRAVTDSVSLDVIELDAASHNKVEDIRELRSGVSTVASVGGAKRVFILDEAHMLTKAASNALLKTLEEPPEGVHFVLATTEPYRLLDTIRSRSQRFDFHLVSIDRLVKHLQEVSDAEGYQAAPEGLAAVARRADGSVRDALSLLEQAAAADGTVTEEGLSRALGAAGRESFPALAEAMTNQDAGAVLRLVYELAGQGVNMRRFAADAIEFFRGVFLVQYAPEAAGEAGHFPEAADDWKQVADVLPPAAVRRAIEQLGEVLAALREGREERITMELALLKLTRPELDDDTAALLTRIERLERGQPASVPSAPARTERPPPAASPAKKGAVPAAETAEAAPPPAVPAPQPKAPAGEVSLEALEGVWPQLVASVREQSVRKEALFRDTVASRVEDGTIFLIAPSAFFLKSLQADEALQTFLAERATALLGAEARFAFEINEGDAPPLADSPPAPPRSPDPAPDPPSPPDAPPTQSSDPVSVPPDTPPPPPEPDSPSSKPLTFDQVTEEFRAKVIEP